MWTKLEKKIAACIIKGNCLQHRSTTRQPKLPTPQKATATTRSQQQLSPGNNTAHQTRAGIKDARRRDSCAGFGTLNVIRVCSGGRAQLGGTVEAGECGRLEGEVREMFSWEHSSRGFLLTSFQIDHGNNNEEDCNQWRR